MQVADATTAYVQTPKALFAIDVESGQERWHVEAQDTWWIYANAVSNGIVYATVSAGNSGDQSLLALEAANGKQIWKTTIAPLDRRGVEDVEVKGDRVYIHEESNFFVLQARDGKVLWSSYATSSVRAGGVVFLTRWRKTGDSIIDAVQEKDGLRTCWLCSVASARPSCLVTACERLITYWEVDYFLATRYLI